jgi:DnaJ-class molecular chaperone
VAKTNAQNEKSKREFEKRKKTEKVIRKLAADMPVNDANKGPTPPSTHEELPSSRSKTLPGQGVKCLRCDGTGRLTSDCTICSGRGTMAVRCRKCAGTGTFTQEAGPCARCKAKGVLLDGTKCPRCKGHKTQMAFSTTCSQCAGSGSFDAPCKRCGGSLHFEVNCSSCNGTGYFQGK